MCDEEIGGGNCSLRVTLGLLRISQGGGEDEANSQLLGHIFIGMMKLDRRKGHFTIIFVHFC